MMPPGRCIQTFFVAEEGTWSSFRGVRDVLESRGYSRVCTVTGALITGGPLWLGGVWTRRTRRGLAKR